MNTLLIPIFGFGLVMSGIVWLGFVRAQSFARRRQKARVYTAHAEWRARQEQRKNLRIA